MKYRSKFLALKNAEQIEAEFKEYKKLSDKVQIVGLYKRVFLIIVVGVLLINVANMLF